MVVRKKKIGVNDRNKIRDWDRLKEFFRLKRNYHLRKIINQEFKNHSRFYHFNFAVLMECQICLVEKEKEKFIY